jgi:hypothetical protein
MKCTLAIQNSEMALSESTYTTALLASGVIVYCTLRNNYMASDLRIGNKILLSFVLPFV